jgi:hypothetical protein
MAAAIGGHRRRFSLLRAVTFFDGSAFDSVL